MEASLLRFCASIEIPEDFGSTSFPKTRRHTAPILCVNRLTSRPRHGDFDTAAAAASTLRRWYCWQAFRLQCQKLWHGGDINTVRRRRSNLDTTTLISTRQPQFGDRRRLQHNDLDMTYASTSTRRLWFRHGNLWHDFNEFDTLRLRPCW